MTPSPQYHTFAAADLHGFIVDVFQSFEVPDADARTAADVLIASDLRGIDSHGVARLITYVDMLTAGRINPTPSVTIVRESASTATVNGDNGLGLVVGPKANTIAMRRARGGRPPTSSPPMRISPAVGPSRPTRYTGCASPAGAPCPTTHRPWHST